MKWYLDIETRVTRNEFPYANKALEEITIIQIVRDNDAVVLGTRNLINENCVDSNFRYVKCADEVDMLNKFLDMLECDNPSLVYAWNGKKFDFPYIYNRLKNLKLDYARMDYENPRWKDLMLVYKLYGDKLKSYSLDSVSKHELNDSKVKHEEFTTFDSFYTGEGYDISDEPYDDPVREEIRQLKILERDGKLTDTTRLSDLIFYNYVHYGIKDSILMKRIDEKRNLSSYM